jgi:heme exporter protein B
MKSSLLARSLRVARKDWSVERRSLAGLASTGLFALVTLAAISMALGPFAAGSDVLASLLWIVLFFAGFAGLAQGFAREFDAHTASHLKLLAGAHEVLIGKFLMNLWLLALVELFAVPLFLVLMEPKVARPGVFLATLTLADLGFAAASTLLAAIVGQARSRGALFAGISLPILIPLLLAAIGGTKVAFGAGSEASPHLLTLASFDAVLMGVSMLLIEPVWNE